MREKSNVKGARHVISRQLASGALGPRQAAALAQGLQLCYKRTERDYQPTTYQFDPAVVALVNDALTQAKLENAA